MNTNNNLASQDHWDDTYRELDFFKPNIFDPIRKIIQTYIKKTTDKKTAFEIGCFPGRYLSVFGDLGYNLNGIDLTPRVEKEMPAWLSRNSYNIGEFHHADFLTHTSNQTYDVVCSFGFIEHFTNYEDIIRKHLPYVSKGGHLIITTPNFSGELQRMLHTKLDKENLNRHHLPAMDPRVWKKILEDENFSVIYCGWKGGFDFWAESENNKPVGKFLIKILNLSGKILRFIPFNSRLFSPYSVVVAKR